jgi:hypothetical protein
LAVVATFTPIPRIHGDQRIPRISRISFLFFVRRSSLRSYFLVLRSSFFVFSSA